MFRRSLLALLLTLFAFAAVAGAQTPPSQDLLLHQRSFLSNDVTQVAALLNLPPAPPAGYTQEQFLQIRVDAAVQYFIQHGYLVSGQNFGVHLTTGEDGTHLLTIDGPGIHVVIVLPCGPFLPYPVVNQQLMTAVVVRHISNGF
jgi:hypothetical protein